MLEGWLPDLPPFQFYYPSRQYMPSALRAFVDYVKARQA
jgi:DNA-binding transcriptional LysR family regulator